MERFGIESGVRGCHIYKDILGGQCWGRTRGLPCQRKNGNHADPFAVVNGPQVAKESHSRKLQYIYHLVQSLHVRSHIRTHST